MLDNTLYNWGKRFLLQGNRFSAYLSLVFAQTLTASLRIIEGGDEAGLDKNDAAAGGGGSGRGAAGASLYTLTVSLRTLLNGLVNLLISSCWP